ncbi:hypothetical protein ACR9YC_07015 [Parasphingorhabdus sp. DH2-15]|uniref:hypothetical protein n=1 Tax=Parasphingorhabdus sp. DH2-15 TaxID=3444112 RepID=UPI003F686DF5
MTRPAYNYSELAKPSPGLARRRLMKSITTIMKGDESGELVNINAAAETNIGRWLGLG